MPIENLAGINWTAIVTGIGSAVAALLGAWGKNAYAKRKAKNDSEAHLQNLYNSLLEADRLFREEVRQDLAVVKKEKMEMDLRHDEEIAKITLQFQSLEARYDELVQRHSSQLLINERLLEEKVDWMNRALAAEAHLKDKEKHDNDRQVT